MYNCYQERTIFEMELEMIKKKERKNKSLEEMEIFSLLPKKDLYLRSDPLSKNKKKYEK